MPEKILGALGATAATIVARKLIEETFNRAGRRPGLLGRALEAAPRRGARLVDGRVLFSACRSGTC
ncbi:MAG: hypothetical protein E6J58_21240 [Deltaproteobacteria bacterium]|nr:MAG: hypothetical protein E6J58_21240 [Deltaproteobacteria bacterium]